MVLSTIIKSLKYLSRKPYTRLVPERESPFKTKSLRGAHILDMNKCTGCSMCQQVCPAACIDMVVVDGKWPQNPRSRFPRIDHSKCTFCALCAEYCPFGALSMTNATGFELFTLDKVKTLKQPFDLAKPVGEPTVSKNDFMKPYSVGGESS